MEVLSTDTGMHPCYKPLACVNEQNSLDCIYTHWIADTRWIAYTSTVAGVAMDNIVKSHGVPNSALAGRDTQSFSVFQLYMASLLGCLQQRTLNFIP
jgi:hypothetical protein